MSGTQGGPSWGSPAMSVAAMAMPLQQTVRSSRSE